MYNLFLDDVRNANVFLQDIRTWLTVRSYDEFTRIIQQRGLPAFISFDHDLANEHYPINDTQYNENKIDYAHYREKTGYDCAKWLIEYCMRTEQELPEFQVHSMNPVGRKNIVSILENYKNKSETIL